MIALDTNILVYAHREEMPQHARARAVVEEVADEPGAWGIPWPCVHEFLAVVSNPRVFKKPTPMATALSVIESIYELPNSVFLAEGETHFATLAQVLRAAHVTGAVVHDGRIAAICITHGVRELWSADRDFSRFPQLTVRNPLVTLPQ